MQMQLEDARVKLAAGDHVGALKVTEELFSRVHGEEKHRIARLEAQVFTDLGLTSRNIDFKITCLFAAVVCLSRIDRFYTDKARACFNLANECGSSVYYKRAVKNAIKSFAFLGTDDLLEKQAMEKLIKTANSRLKSGALLGPVDDDILEADAYYSSDSSVEEFQNEDTVKISDKERLEKIWEFMGLNLQRRFLTVRIHSLLDFVERRYGERAAVALEAVLKSVEKKREWVSWVCRTCSEKFTTREACQDHLEREHAAGFVPSQRMLMPQRISEDWVDKISSVRDWKPVDAVTAVQMIKDQSAFVYEEGWCKDWPLAADQLLVRSRLLADLRALLVSLIQQKVLSVSMRDRMLHFVLDKFEKLEVSEQMLNACRLLNTPQSFCFLECRELNQILTFLRKFKFERFDDFVCRAVDGFCQNCRVKEKIDFDYEKTMLLLDRRLLKGERGDEILKWLMERSAGEDAFRFPESVDRQNYDVWVASLRSIQFTVNRMHSKLSEKLALVEYYASLQEARGLCINESKMKPGGVNMFVSLLSERCKHKATSKKLFISAVEDVLKRVETIPENLKDDAVMSSLEALESTVNEKVAQIDASIIFTDNSRMKLMSSLVKLSFFDYRWYIQIPLKKYMEDCLRTRTEPSS